MPANDRCPNCGVQRPSTAPAGLCPQCLLRLGLGAELSNGSHAEPTLLAGLSRTASVLMMLDDAVGPVPRVLLRDTQCRAPRPHRRLAGAPVRPGRILRPGYQLFGEIARGGMGAVLKGRDADLGRDLAVKVLLEQHRDKPELVAPVRRGGADRRPAPAPGDRAGVRARNASPTAGPTSP